MLIVPCFLLQVTNSAHKAHLSHELIAAAASYEVYCKRLSMILTNSYPYQAAKAYENHVKENGKPVSHEKAKELLYVSLKST